MDPCIQWSMGHSSSYYCSQFLLPFISLISIKGIKIHSVAQSRNLGSHPWFLHPSPPAANPPPPPADLILLIFIQPVCLPPSSLLLHTLTQVTTIFCPHYCTSFLTSLPELSLPTPLHFPFCGQSDFLASTHFPPIAFKIIPSFLML